ncbi:fibronectin type III domain-containing protein [Paenibacillus sp. YIM B09110]|uniref:fibronectin type III domain-containing protein n=1 Tax=Paenibacillus sp. YIM B09110 TaxID=3126102 RepID=UPI00301BD9D4
MQSLRMKDLFVFRNYYIYAILVAAIAAFVLMGEQTLAAPAAPIKGEYIQPDGTVFTAQKVGDEHFNWTAADSGAVIVQNEDGYWYYAENKGGKLVASKNKFAIHKQPSQVLSSKDVTPLYQNNLTTRDESNGLSKAPVIVSGEIKTNKNLTKPHPLLVVLVEFNDISLSTTEADWSNLIFGAIGKTVNTFYKENSSNKFYFLPANETSGTTNNGVVKVTLAKNHPDTAENTSSVNRQLVADALRAANPQVNFASYDSNKDGHISSQELHIVTIIAGQEAAFYDYEYSGIPSVWGHQWTEETSKAPVIDGVKILNHAKDGSYTQFGEMQGDHQATVGIIVHELGHDLDLPDLYDVDGDWGEDTGGVGDYSVMGAGSWTMVAGEYFGATPVHFDAWSKLFLGFEKPMDLAFGFDALVTLNAINTEDLDSYNIIKVPTIDPTEYFLLENRQQKDYSGFDQGLFFSSNYPSYYPYFSSGIAIWHIDLDILTNNFYSVNATFPLGVELVSYYGYPDDPFYRLGSELNDFTNPNSRLNNNQASGVTIRVKSESSPNMLVDVDFETITVSELTPVEVKSNTLKLQWPSLSNATKISVMQREEFGEWTVAKTDTILTTATSATVSNLKPNSYYEFQLIVSGGINAGPSNIIALETYGIKLLSFTNTGKTDRTASFKWEAAANVYTYFIQQSSDGGQTWIDSVTNELTAESTMATVTGLSPNSAYQFRLFVVGGINRGESNAVTLTTLTNPISNLVISAVSGNSADLRWTAPVGASKLIVQQSLNAKTWTNAATGNLNANASEAEVNGLQSGTLYYFRVLVTGGHNDGVSNVEDAVTASVPISELSVKGITTNTVVLSWPAAIRAKTIYVEYSVNGGLSWKEEALKVSGSAKTATVKGLLPNTAYQFRLKIAEGANMGTSNIAEGVTKPVPLKNFASTGRANLKATSAEFRWPGAIGATEIEIQLSTDGKAWNVVALDNINSTAIVATVTGLTPATKYFFRLNVIGGQNEGQSNSVTVTTIPLPLSDLSVDEGETTGSKITLNWKAAVGANKLVIQQSLNGKSWTNSKVMVPLVPSAESAVVTGLVVGTDYIFRITVTGGQNAGTSNPVGERTLIAPIDSLKVNSYTSNSVSLAWSAASKATAIQLQQLVGGDWVPVAGVSISASGKSITIKGLTPNTSYAYRIFVTGGGNEGESNEVEVRTKSLSISGFTSTSKTAYTSSFKWKEITGAEQIYILYSLDGKIWSEVYIAADSITTTVDDLTANQSYKFKLVVVGGQYEGESSVVTVKTNRA